MDSNGTGEGLDAAGEMVPRRMELALWFVAIAIALVVRWWQPDVVPWRADEAKAASFAWRIAEGREYPLLGLRTSWGFHNPPTLFYIFAPVFWMSRSLVPPSMVVGLVGVVGCVFAGLTGRALFGVRAGVMVLMITGCCGSAIEHSRRLWGHDLIVPASAVVLWLMLPGGGVGPSRWRVFLACVMAAVAQSVHLSGVLLWLPIVWVLAWLRDGVLGRWAGLCGVLALGLVYAPWFVGNAGSDWEDVGLMRMAVEHGRAQALGHPVGPAAAWVFQLGDGLNDDMLRVMRPWEVSSSGFLSSLAANVGGLGLVAGGISFGCLMMLRRGREGGACGALLLLMGAPLLVFAVLFRASVPPYMLPGLVPAALLAGGLFARCQGALHRVGALLVCASACCGGAQGQVEIRGAVERDLGIAVPTIRGLQEVVLEMVSCGMVLRQNARPASVGWDDGLVTVYYSVTGRSTVPVVRGGGEGLLVLVEPYRRLPAEVAVLLRGYEARVVGGRLLYVLDAVGAERYEALVDGPAEARAW